MKSFLIVRMWTTGVVLVTLLVAACAGHMPLVPTATFSTLRPVTQPPSVATFTPTPTVPEATATPSPTSTVTATGTPTFTPTPTSTPTFTPTPTATPTFTPTPLPDARLQLGRTFYELGNYAAAIEQFQTLLTDPAVEPSESAEAHFLLARCYWLNGDSSSATVTFQAFVDSYPDDARQPAARFQQAEAYAALEQWEAALEGYRAYLAERDVVASAVHERIGDAYVQLGDDEQALVSYQAALESLSYLDGASDLREEIADIHLRNEEYELAIAQYERILQEAQSNAYRAQAEYLLGQAYLLAGDAEAAYGHWTTAVSRYPKEHHAYLSLSELVNAGVEVDEFQRGTVDYYAGVYGAAVQALYRYLESDVTERRDEARYYVGRAYHLSGSYHLAINEYDALIAAYPDSPMVADFWFEKACSQVAQERTDDATETLLTFVEMYPDHELAPEALWRAAQLHEDQVAWAEAVTVYQRLREDYPASSRAAEALFRAGLSHFRLADYQAAIEDWQALTVEYAASDRLPAAWYWLGKAYSALGDDVQATKSLQSVAGSSLSSPDYYVLRADHRLKALQGSVGAESSIQNWPSTQPNLLLDFDEAAAQAEVGAWLLTWVDLSEEMNDLSTLSEVLAQDPHYQRGVEYMALGLDSEALAEFKAMRLAHRDDPLIMYGLALATRELGVYETSIRCALRVVQLSPMGDISDAPWFIQYLAYPIYFGDLVLSEAAAQNLDPLLVFALIRQESLFSPRVRSYAAAVGLMQIIPSTGEWIAFRLGCEGFTPEHLTRPYLNVRFGTWFLAQALNAFRGDVFAALAGYNAGLAAPGRWMEVADGDPDLFVETIDYSQTVNYIRLIYEHQAVYRLIYQSVP